jgi:ABC-2 type transport system permease protein
MNYALWWKSLREGWWLLVACAALLYFFSWMNVWLVSEVESQNLLRLLRYFRNPMLEQLLPVPLEVLVSSSGRLAAGFDHPLVMVPICVWAIARGSDSISGEIGRGTMEVLLAQPVRRIEVLVSQAGITVLGALVLCLSVWLGILTGLDKFNLAEEPLGGIFLPAVSNLFCLSFALAGLTTFLSSFDRFRTRTIGLAVGILLLEIVLALVSISAPENWAWVRWTTFVSSYQPQLLSFRFWPEVLTENADLSWRLLWHYDASLLALGAICYTVAAVIFCRRDLPAPL